MPSCYKVIATTSASSAATVYLPEDGSGQTLNGRIHSIHYTRPSTNPLSTTADFTITTERNSMQVWTQSNVAASATKHPRVLCHDTVGSSTAVTLRDYIYVANDRIKIVIAQGGAAKLGTFEVVVDA